MTLKPFVCSIAAVALLAPAPVGVAREARGGQHHFGQAEDTLPAAVREATWRYRDLDAAIADKYVQVPGCVSGPEEGAMGVHYARTDRFDGELDVDEPEVLVYEPKKDGRLELVAAEYVAPAAAWHAANPMAQPVLNGHLLHFVNGPNRYGPDAFYELHVWAWKHNPRGTFADWNPSVSCASWNGGS
jgi:hypothetical protein